MKIPIKQIHLYFMPQCECGCKPAIITPADLEESGTPLCSECDILFSLATHGEIPESTPRHLAIYEVAVAFNDAHTYVRVAVDTNDPLTHATETLEAKAKKEILAQDPSRIIQKVGPIKYVTHARF